MQEIELLAGVALGATVAHGNVLTERRGAGVGEGEKSRDPLSIHNCIFQGRSVLVNVSQSQDSFTANRVRR